jgi:hypothetical protein
MGTEALLGDQMLLQVAANGGREVSVSRSIGAGRFARFNDVFRLTHKFFAKAETRRSQCFCKQMKVGVRVLGTST